MSAGAAASLRSSSRLGIVLAMVGSLAATGAMQSWMLAQRQTALIAAPAASNAQTSLSDLNSFSLALLLGGLRGPLVMFLWTSSESQKTQRDLEDFDTKIEMIRLLQPEFASVHIFQMWNKAYNISAQMSSVANKYTTILDALDYGQRVDRQRPNDLNILTALARIWFDKLGSSQEKEYYVQRVMEETRWRATRGISNPGQRRYRLEPMLDAAGNILPEYLQPHAPARPIGPSADGEIYDGSELQYLRAFQPFPYGLPPLALGYDYYKRAQVLMDTTRQTPLEVSEVVISSRPAVTLKLWGEWELSRGRRLEAQALSQAPQPTPQELALQSAAQREQETRRQLAAALLVGPQVIKNIAEAREALYRFGLVHRLARAAITEYDRYQRHFSNNLVIYEQHREELRTLELEALADEDFLSLNLGVSGDYRAAQAAEQNVVTHLHFFLLKHYTDDQTTIDVLGPGAVRLALRQDQFSAAQWARLFDRAQAVIRDQHRPQMEGDLRAGWLDALQRAQGRLDVLQALQAPPPH